MLRHTAMWSSTSRSSVSQIICPPRVQDYTSYARDRGSRQMPFDLGIGMVAMMRRLIIITSSVFALAGWGFAAYKIGATCALHGCLYADPRTREEGTQRNAETETKDLKPPMPRVSRGPGRAGSSGGQYRYDYDGGGGVGLASGGGRAGSIAESELSKIGQFRRALEQLPKGKIVLDAPKAMKVGDTRAVYANVGVNVPIELLRGHSRPTDQSHEALLSVSSVMAATLTGPGFAITPTTPEQQGVAEGFPTVWSWNVEAKHEGEQELEATLYVLMPTRQRIDSYTHKIGVSVKAQSWGEWLKSSKEEVEAVHVIAITFGSALMAVLGWLGLSYSRRRQTENRNQPETT